MTYYNIIFVGTLLIIISIILYAIPHIRVYYHNKPINDPRNLETRYYNKYDIDTKLISYRYLQDLIKI